VIKRKCHGGSIVESKTVCFDLIFFCLERNMSEFGALFLLLSGYLRVHRNNCLVFLSCNEDVMSFLWTVVCFQHRSATCSHLFVPVLPCMTIVY
jgi:hypothetical protein